ncbi:uncharacterized protein LOC116140416 [Pistacia vera]|uniref:uncharacterized protein LOC116140416 n=1 Tax=Pistacia vera TaxID=55513 RepID=UPI00126396EF|nr:uncharacterized protein LOC116140416 [Pistacia vera]
MDYRHQFEEVAALMLGELEEVLTAVFLNGLKPEIRAEIKLQQPNLKFVNGYGKIALPLTNLLRKDAFHWIESSQKAFEELKQVITTVPVLSMPNFSKTFIIETDASRQGIDAVLMQEGRLLAFLS